MLMRTSSPSLEPGNLLLRQLSSDDRALIGDGLERVAIERGALLVEANEMLDTVYFPETVLVAIEKGIGGNEHIETGLIGSEGMIGWSALLGCSHSTYNAVVQMRSGTMLRISTHNIAKACASSSTLLATMMRFVEIITVQMAQAIISHLRDTIERRVSRWLLMRHDRFRSNELPVMHEEISGNLGVRRASVTDCLHILEGEHLIRCYRGRIIIRDRERLEAWAADSYGTAEDHYRSLIGPFGRSCFRELPSSFVAFPHLPVLCSGTA